MPSKGLLEKLKDVLYIFHAVYLLGEKRGVNNSRDKNSSQDNSQVNNFFILTTPSLAT